MLELAYSAIVRHVGWLGITLLVGCSVFPDAAPRIGLDAGGAGASGSAGAAGASGSAGAAGGAAGASGSAGAAGGAAGASGSAGCPGQVILLEPSADTYIVNVPPLSVHGTKPLLEIRTYNQYAATRALVRFDDLPAGAVVVRATLSLLLSVNEGGVHQVGAHRAQRDWAENTASWNKYDGVTDWSKPGADFALGPTAVVTVDDSTPIGARLEWDVTSDVEQFFAGAQMNYGWVLRDDNDTELSGQRLNFPSREAAQPGDRPALRIEIEDCGFD
jgi:hypothetical protein